MNQNWCFSQILSKSSLWKNANVQGQRFVHVLCNLIGSTFSIIDLFLENHLLRYWTGTLTMSLLANLFPRKFEPWFVLWFFFSSEFALYQNKPAIGPYIVYCFYAYAGGPSCYFNMFDKLQKQAYRTASNYSCRFCRTLGSSLKWSQRKSFLLILLWYKFIWTG